MDIGYAATGQPPNPTVQAILSLIPNAEIHELILCLNKQLPEGAFSPILHLGFSMWYDIFTQLDEKNMIFGDCRPIIEKVFNEIQEILADRTDLDDVLSIECKAATEFLEETHKLKDPSFTDVEGKVKTKPIEIPTDANNTQGCMRWLPKEDFAIMKSEMDAGKKSFDRDNLVRLTLNNCRRFPIISEMAIEWLGEEFQQGLWRSMNYGTLAPISKHAWRLLAGISDQDMEYIIASTNNLEKIMDKVEIPLPFGTDLFDKRCNKYDKIILHVKAHMGFPEADRSYSYLHKIWRSWSPYIKCDCEKCDDSITWLDQAIWYIFNHLDLVYPKYSWGGKLVCFLHFIRNNLKKAVMTQLAYLHFRDTMFMVTNKLTTSPDCDLKQIFGDTQLVDACEIMIKDEKFLKKRFNLPDDTAGPSSVKSSFKDGCSQDFLPPRVARSTISSRCNIINLDDTTDSIVNCTPGEQSVNMGSVFQRYGAGVQTKLFVEKAGDRPGDASRPNK